MIGSLIALAIFSSLSLNLIVQFGLGVQEISDEHEKLPFFQITVIFITVLFLWALFTYIITLFSSVFFEYLLFFPLSSAVCFGLERAASRFFPATVPQKGVFNPLSAYNGIALTALILTRNIAATFVEAAVVSLFFSLGILLSILVLNRIRKRSSTEAVPLFLRGKPLLLISMGFLLLIFTSVAAILLNAFGGV